MHRLYHWQPRNWAEARTLLGDDDGGNGGGGNNQQRLTAAELLARHGASAERLAEKLETAYADNFTVREKNRGLTEQVATLTTKVPAEGAVILTGEAAKAYDAYKALGKPDEVKARLEAGDAASGEVATLRRNGVLRDAAQRHGYDFDALKAHAGDLPLTPYEAEDNGQKVTRYRVGEGAEQAEIGDWAGKQPAFVQRALTPFGTEQGGTGQRQGVQTYPAQQGSNGQAPRTNAQVAGSYMQNTYPGPPKRG